MRVIKPNNKTRMSDLGILLKEALRFPTEVSLRHKKARLFWAETSKLS